MENQSETHAELAAVIDELRKLGLSIENLGDLIKSKDSWKTATPVLIEWLAKVQDIQFKEVIVRKLTVPWVKNEGTARLIEQFRHYAPLGKEIDPWVGKTIRELSSEEKTVARIFSLAWAIGNALSVVNIDDFEDEILELSGNKVYGKARQMMVYSLARTKRPEAEDLALALLEDEQVQLHAIYALGKMKSQRALAPLEGILQSAFAPLRSEARKSIAKIIRASRKKTTK